MNSLYEFQVIISFIGKFHAAAYFKSLVVTVSYFRQLFIELKNINHPTKIKSLQNLSLNNLFISFNFILVDIFIIIVHHQQNY